MLKAINSHSLNIIICWIIINNVVCVSSLQLMYNGSENASSLAASSAKILRTIYSYLRNGSHMESSDSSNGSVTTTAATTTTTTTTTMTSTTTSAAVTTTTETMAWNLFLLEQGEDETQLNESNDGLRRVYKRNIPALEPVKHLLNGVRSGNLTNHTSLFNWNHLAPPSNMEMPTEMLDDSMAENQTSAAIETKEEREMTNVSPNLKVLELLGAFGSKVWAFLRHVRQGFFNFVGNASAASSAASST